MTDIDDFINNCCGDPNCTNDCERRKVMKEKTDLVCVPTSQLNIIEGSTRRTGDCGHEVWVSPVSRNMIDSGLIDTITCVPCATKKMQEPDEPVEVRVHTDSLREAYNYLHRN